MKVLILSIVLFTSVGAKLIVSKTEVPNAVPWKGWDADNCGGLTAIIWSDGKGWHQGSCGEIAETLSKLRDVKEVGLKEGPDVADMLAFGQYEEYFRISQKDLDEARQKCRTIVEEGYAHPNVLAHCRSVVKGEIPYGLRVRPE